jgi:hypothetical protein
MKLDRNITNPRRGKYALIKLREARGIDRQTLDTAARENLCVTLQPSEIDLGDTEDSDFFVIRLKDKYAYEALRAYGQAAYDDHQEEYALK